MLVSHASTSHIAPANYVEVWDCRPGNNDDPINWVELKTSAEMGSERDMVKYERKLLKFWIQSFLLGVPKIIVGFRSANGILQRLEELETKSIPGMVKRRGKGSWDGNVCINFTASFLDCEFDHSLLQNVRLTRQRVKAHCYRRRSMEDSSARESTSNRSVQASGDWPWRHSLSGILGVARAPRIQRRAYTRRGMIRHTPNRPLQEDFTSSGYQLIAALDLSICTPRYTLPAKEAAHGIGNNICPLRHTNRYHGSV